MAELGLNGEVRESALNLINRLGPHDAPVGGETVTHEEEMSRLQGAFNEFTPELWKHAHPFQRWLLGRERPPHPAPDAVFHFNGQARRDFEERLRCLDESARSHRAQDVTATLPVCARRERL